MDLNLWATGSTDLSILKGNLTNLTNQTNTLT